MEPEARHDEDDFAGLEAELKSLRPRAVRPSFADEVAVESFLAGLTPKALPANLADAVATESALAALTPKAPGDAFVDRVMTETVLRGVNPKALPPEFADRVAAEIALRELAPRALPDGFVDRVLADCARETAAARPAGTIIPFRRFLIPLSAAAALVIAAIPFARRTGPAPVVATAPTPVVASAPVEVLPEGDSVSLPVVNLPDGRAYRPVIRNRYVQPVDFRATPAGVAIPVADRAPTTGVDYEPVMFE